MIKKLGVIFALILSSFMGLVACGDPYKDMSLTLSSYEANLEKEVTLLLKKDDDGNYVSNEINVKAEVKGAGKGVSEEVIFTEATLNDKFVGIKDIKRDDNVTTFVLYGKERGKSTLEFKTEGSISKKIVVNVEIGIDNLAFKPNVIPAIAEGDSYDLNINTNSLITFTPGNTSQDDVVYSLDNLLRII